MKFGTFDNRVKIQKVKAAVVNAIGGANAPEYDDILTIWCKIDRISGSTKFLFGQDMPVNAVEIHCRYNEVSVMINAITSYRMLEVGGHSRTFRLIRIKEIDARKEYTTLIAEELWQ